MFSCVNSLLPKNIWSLIILKCLKGTVFTAVRLHQLETAAKREHQQHLVGDSAHSARFIG